ncbi:hypothetical protein LWI29_020714 [Acer saccharum]|uniref:Uncharacterized protein n=1 Tax=Acer saccharum TaxID=4024 RepID=A0AA39W8M2_ACESA|nr:hypothetical protein LWI29_020714 [Acer saccharum]
MDRNIRMEIEEKDNAIASDIAKTWNVVSIKRMGIPVFSLLLPGTVKATEKTMVAMSVATTMHEIEHSWIASLSLGAVFLNRQSSGYLHIDLDVSPDKTFATQRNLGVVKVNRESQAFLACPNLKKNQLMTNGITLVSPGAVPQIDAHHTIQMAEIEIDLQSTQAPQNQLMNRTPPEPNLPIPDLLPRQMDTMVVGLAGGGGPQIGSHDPVLTAESTDGHFTQAPQNHNHAPNYQINLPDHSLLPSKCKNQDQYRLKCVPLQKATLTGNLEEAMPLLGDNPRSMLRIAITEWEETVLHIATGAKQVAFVEEIIELMKLDDLKLQDLNGSTAFCFAAAAGSKNQDRYRLKCVPLQKATLIGNLEEAMPLLGDNPRSMLRIAITEWEETVLHIATGAKQVAFVEEIIELMKLDDLKLQDLNGSTAFCFAAAAGSIEITKLMLDKNLDLLTSYLTIVYFLANVKIRIQYRLKCVPLQKATLTGKNQDQYRLKCVPLQKATLTGNLEEAMPLLGDNPRSMLRTAITEWEETVLHIATGAKQVAFVEEIIELMKLDDLKLQDLNGSTAFCFVAAAGSIEIAKLMLDKNLDLLTLRGAKNMLPLYMAALFGRMEMVNFLYDGTESHLTPQDEADLFFKSINTDMYDMASKLLQHQPQLAVTRDMHQNTTLHVLARKPSSMFACRRTGLFKTDYQLDSRNEVHSQLGVDDVKSSSRAC